MTTDALDAATLRRLTLEFTEKFNANDLDGMMAFFAEDAVYYQHDGELAKGIAAIRAAFEPQFEGAFGKMAFIQDDLFVDAETGKTMVSWLCTLETKRGAAGWRGLDLLHFDADGKIVAKLTYGKAKALRLDTVAAT
ncbi:MAG: nuclear transport factor 2 family protein [Alphaproteobacteria bacterium]|jgi:ketosteroid isomerase-like protein|nr:nuclear transport factor 2 family protein [Alphaproteobacteria bacterium]MDP6567394.1 nuclear transport factor 2 family protein [Alphaproteobacteria bacterium]MDP6814834.1 nuclear transport factor 2 family protein [Alphaproteobacteria bacterium]